MSAELLREAAALMRERAEAATPGGPRWETCPMDEQPSRRLILPADSDSAIAAAPVDEAEHIASWHPAVALAVADWLDHAAARAESKIEHGGKPEPAWSHERDALAVARVYLGETS